MEERTPQPIEIYRRRRAAAIAGIALVILLFFALIIMLLPDSDGDNTASQTGTDTGSNQGVIPNTSEPKTSTPGAVPPHPPAPVNPHVPPNTPKCIDDNIAVTVSADKPDYKPNEKPIFKAIVTNAGAYACVRDVGSGLEQFVVLDFNGNQIWANYDCDSEPGVKNTLLNPGQQVGFNMEWNKQTSAKGCPADARKPVPPGQYQIIAKLNMVSSRPQTFNILPK